MDNEQWKGKKSQVIIFVEQDFSFKGDRGMAAYFNRIHSIDVVTTQSNSLKTVNN